MTTFFAVQQGWRDFSRERVATIFAALLTAAAAMMLDTTARHAAADVAELQFRHAAALFFFGTGAASLLLDTARALALSAYGRAEQPFRAALSRVPALISITALEVTFYMLVGGVAFLLVPRVLDENFPAGRGALLCALGTAPIAMILVGAFFAARVATVLAARGVAPSAALVHGVDFTMRRFPSLVRLFFAWVAVASPLLGAAFLLPPLALPLVEVAALFGYAALANLVGSDARLVHG